MEMLDSAEREIVEREIREGKLSLEAQVANMHSKQVGATRRAMIPLGMGDIRDLRDPAKLGERILHERRRFQGKPLSEVADYVDAEA